ncbi:esterase, PHB depolymerase family [Streptomyces misionensis]|uniref:Esterase, PHB depolymerase family n=1 Tax=Streptomyces misionensis TaxID=67331 RepID=A0A1H5F351_9ACTN|nr:PHB depolymerase family esterase [Streptomyces misionensis]SED97588.1 esterase, PHB depolymerase family [Streptomyces misionensis]
MPRKVSARLAAVLAATSLVLSVLIMATPASAASLTQVTNFGDNPGNMQMYVYVPDTHTAKPPIVLAMHGCGGSGPAFYSGSEFASLADRYGFIVIYPTATQSAGFGNCFDTWSDAAKHRGGGSDPVSLISMINYVEQHYNGDAERVFATGSSSGGMMTDEMLALYPDVFKAGAAFMGVPFGCFADAADYPPSTSKCTGGSMTKTPQEWGDLVRQAYPGYAGPRPPLQLWHGTSDTLVPYQLLQEDIKQWTDVFGVSRTPTSTDTPQAGWTRQRFADVSGTTDVEAYSVQGAGHSLPSSGMAGYAIQFFGLAGSPGTTPPAGGTGCKVTTAVSSWNTGMTENITITDTGGSAVNGWSLKFTLPGGQTITNGWNASYTPSSGQVTATNAGFNGAIAPGQSTTIGFQATHTGDTAAPTAFVLNGATCATG